MNELEESIIASCKLAYQENGWTEFWPHQFDELDSIDNILAALRQLVEDGYFFANLKIIDLDGQTKFEGDPKSLKLFSYLQESDIVYLKFKLSNAMKREWLKEKDNVLSQVSGTTEEISGSNGM